MIRQGKKSIVRLTTFNGRKAIVKVYNSTGDPRIKKEREVLFYNHYQGHAPIPDLLDSSVTGEITVSFLEGQVLDKGYQLFGIEDMIASSHRDLLAAQRICSSVPDFMGDRDYATYALDVVDKVADLAGENGQGWLQAQCEAVRSTLVKNRGMPAIVYKEDWNIGNMVLATEGIRFIDFEQAYVGNVLMYFGAVLDCSGYCDPMALIDSLVSKTSLRGLPLDEVLTMAKYNCFLRLRDRWADGKLDEAAFRRLNGRISRIDQLANKALERTR